MKSEDSGPTRCKIVVEEMMSVDSCSRQLGELVEFVEQETHEEARNLYRARLVLNVATCMKQADIVMVMLFQVVNERRHLSVERCRVQILESRSGCRLYTRGRETSC